MIRDIKLPEISENIDTAQVINILVSKGDQVEEEQAIVEMETEKAVFEVPSPVAGILAEINVKEGEEIKVGQLVAKIETKSQKKKEGDGPADEKNSTGKIKKHGREIVQDSKAPPAGEKTGTEEKKEQADSGTEKEQAVSVEKEEEQAEPQEKQAPKAGEPSPGKPAPASPSVRRLARELGIDIHSVTGSGPGGRISADDVKSHTKKRISGTSREQVVELPDFSRWGETKREPMSTVRKVTARHTKASWTTIPQVTHFDEADITDVEKFRKKYAKIVQDAGGKLTITSILMKITASALQLFPKFNASLDLQNEEIIYKSYINIGVAVDTERGLLVPVIRNVDRKNLTEISVELTDLAERTRNKKIKPDEMEGGNITLSNLGGIGGSYFTPVVLAPQGAILGVSRASKRPIVTDDGFETRLILPLTLSYDHRMIDGADSARFLNRIVSMLEDPFSMFL